MKVLLTIECELFDENPPWRPADDIHIIDDMNRYLDHSYGRFTLIESEILAEENDAN